MRRLTVAAPDGVPEVARGTDLAALVAGALAVRDGDVVVVTSKVVSKAEGRVREGTREAAVAEEAVRVVARRGPTVVVRNALGLTMAAAGVDASNVPAGSVALLPVDPDASARRVRADLLRLTGANVGVVVTDTAGRAWREGQTDIAIGAAGLLVTVDHAGLTDSHGNPLHVTLPAVADEIAAAADLVRGKLAGRPFALVSGVPELVLAAGEDGPGAVALVRPEGDDLFGYGAREAVIRALAGLEEDRAPFGRPVTQAELVRAIARVPPDPTAVAAVCFAHGWALEEWREAGTDVVVGVSPRTT